MAKLTSKTINCNWNVKGTTKIVTRQYSNIIHVIVMTWCIYGFPLGTMKVQCDQTGSGKIQMAASKLQMHVSPFPDNLSTKFQRLYLCCRRPTFHWDPWEYYATKLDWKNPRWWPLNFKCIFLHYQTINQWNSNGYTYVFGVRLSIGTNENTMRPNRKWKNPRCQDLNFKCIFLHYQTINQWNSNGYTYVFVVRLFIGTHEKFRSCDQTESGKTQNNGL